MGYFAADPSEPAEAKRQLLGPFVWTRWEPCSTPRVGNFCVLLSMPAYLFRMFNMFREKFSIKINMIWSQKEPMGTEKEPMGTEKEPMGTGIASKENLCDIQRFSWERRCK